MANAMDDKAVTADKPICYVRGTHLFFRLKEGKGFSNEGHIFVDNTGQLPIWIQLLDFKCSVYNEGFDVFYTCPIQPGQSRQYRMTLAAVPVTTRRVCTSVLKKDSFVSLDFNVGVYKHEPDGQFEAPTATKTSVHCAILLPEGMSTKYKIVRHIERIE
jgi:hypothetical protein